MTTPNPSPEAASKGKLYVTIAGLPLTIALHWPFHRSGGGADYFVLHGDIRLENGDGLHVPVAINLTQTVRRLSMRCAKRWTTGNWSF
jgi:hypothetical protein